MNDRCNANKDKYITYCNDCQKKEDNCAKSNRVLLKCSTGGAAILGQIREGQLPSIDFNNAPVNVVTINIDTSEFSHPCIKIDFACNIATIVDSLIPDTVLSLNFQIFRQCSKQAVPIPIGSPWTYSEPPLDIGVAGQSDAIRFFVCDQPCKNECCCNYFVVVTPGASAQAALYIGQINVNNATLSVTAIDGSCNC